MFKKALVQDVIYNPLEFDWTPFLGELEPDELAEEPEEPPTISGNMADVPGNSLVIRVITENLYVKEQKYKIAYPMLSSHVMMPIKVGEVVWIFQDGAELFWLSRVHGKLSYEDVNLTHENRKIDGPLAPGAELGTIDKADGASGAVGNIIPKFDDDEGAKLFDEVIGFDELLDLSLTLGAQMQEPVPRFSKRPGDLTLQGSNNTLISLGTRRGWTIDDTDFSLSNATPKDETELCSGCIDIVAGRGRYLPILPPTDSVLIQPDGEAVRTGPYTIVNTRGDTEVDKNRIMNFEQTQNHAEGDPDFVYDASRVYVSAKADCDTLFGLIDYYPTVPAWSMGTGPGTSLGDNGVPPPINDTSSCIVQKADEIRIIARHVPMMTATPADPGINGSIKLIKEGTTGKGRLGDDAAVIMLQPDGTIMLDGPTIIIGSGDSAYEADMMVYQPSHVFLGRGATNPVVLGQILFDFLDKLLGAMESAAPKFVATGSGPGVLDPSILAEVSAFKAGLADILSKYCMVK